MSGTGCKKVSAVTKLGYSAASGALFFAVALPWTYETLNKVFGRGKHVLVDPTGKPSVLGVVIHAVVFTLILFLLMQPWKKTQVCPEQK